MTKTDLVTQLFPFFLDADSLRTISARIVTQKKKLQQSKELDPSWQVYLNLSEKSLEESLRSELSRREAFQRRALAFLGSAAVMSAFTIGSLNLLKTPRIHVPTWTLGIGIITTLAYLACAVWSALKVASPKELFDLTIQNRIADGQPVEGAAWKEVIIHVIQLNQAFNLILAFYSRRSYFCLRNGLIALVATITLLAINSLAAN